MVAFLKECPLTATLLDNIMARPNIIVKALTILFLFFNLSISAIAEVQSYPKIKVVTSFSILENLVQILGGNHVNIINLVGRNADAHTYQPKPSDIVAISNADLIFFNGLEFEGWILRIIAAKEFENKRIIASKGVNFLKNGKEIDPHVWQSFDNIRIYVENITTALIKNRPDFSDDFQKNKEDFFNDLTSLENKLRLKISKIPKEKRVVITSHDAFGYLGRDFDIVFLAPIGLSLDTKASAEDVAKIINQVRAMNVKALFIENISDPRLLNQISNETNTTIGGRLYSDALSTINGDADTYLNMMEHNIQSLINAFKI